MLRTEWDELFDLLRQSQKVVSAWKPSGPDLQAVRCEQSRHRTLAHLRACQEQWMVIVQAFVDRDHPSVTILHPWRVFDQSGYAELPWDDHFAKWTADRERWLEWQETVDWERGGKWNRKPDTIGGLTHRLAHHESYHLNLF